MLRKTLLKTLFIIAIFGTFSCGFNVIYKEAKTDSDFSYSNELAAIRIKKDRNKISQELKNNLYDTINPDLIKKDPKYFLTLDISESITPTFITITGSSGRNKITITVRYTLQNLENAETISSGETFAADNYNITENRYGSYTAENTLRSNLTKILAQNIRNSLVNDFIEIKQKCDAAKAKNDLYFSCPLR